MIKDFFHKTKMIKNLKRGDVLSCKRTINQIEKIYFFVVDDINFDSRLVFVHRICDLHHKQLNSKISVNDLRLRGYRIIDHSDYWGFR